MFDTVVKYFKRETQKTKILVVIEDHQGQKYLIDNRYFVTRRGNSIAEKGRLETLERAARRVMNYVHKTAAGEELCYEHISSSGMSTNRKIFMVWFPSTEQFDPASEKWKGYLYSLTDAHSQLVRLERRVINLAFRKAAKQREFRLSQKSV